MVATMQSGLSATYAVRGYYFPLDVLSAARAAAYCSQLEPIYAGAEQGWSWPAGLAATIGNALRIAKPANEPDKGQKPCRVGRQEEPSDDHG